MDTVNSEEDFNPDFLQRHAASLRKVNLQPRRLQVVREDKNGAKKVGGRKLELAWLRPCSNLDYVCILQAGNCVVGSVNESLQYCLQNLRELRLSMLDHVTGDVGALCRSGLPALEVLELYRCPGLGGDLDDLLQKNPKEKGNLQQPPPVLPRLRVLDFWEMPKLKCSVFPFGTKSFQSLEKLKFFNCPELRGSVDGRLVLEAPKLRELGIIACPHLELAASEGQRKELQAKLKFCGCL